MKWDLIPNLFYDLLGRVVPGAFILTIGGVVYWGIAGLSARALDGSIQKALSGFGQIGVAVVLAYTTGFVLAELRIVSNLFSWRYSHTKDIQLRLRDHECIDKALGRPALDLIQEDIPKVWAMYDHLRATRPDEASRLLKIRAEERFCEVVVSGSIALLLLNVVLLVRTPSNERWILLGLLFVLLSACIKRGLDSRHFFVRGTSSAWFLQISESRYEARKVSQASPEQGTV